MWGVLALICFIFRNKLFTGKDGPGQLEAARRKGRRSERQRRERIDNWEEHHGNKNSTCDLQLATVWTCNPLSCHANHRLTGRAGYDLIMVGTHSHKECTCHQQTIACFGTDGRPPHTIKWHHLSCLVQQRTSTCWKTVLNLPKVNRRGTDLLKHLCEPLGSATAVPARAKSLQGNTAN